MLFCAIISSFLLLIWNICIRIVESVFGCATLIYELSCINGKPLRLKILFIFILMVLQCALIKQGKTIGMEILSIVVPSFPFGDV